MLEGRVDGRETENKEPRSCGVHVDGAPGEIRTPDRLVRSQVLYPAELRARKTLHCLTSACSDAGSAARCSGTPLSTSCFGPGHSPVGSWRSCGQKPNCWLLPLRPHPAELRARKTFHCLTSACSDAGSAARCSGTPLSTSCFGPGHSPVGSWRSCGQKPNCWLLPLRPHPAELRARKTLHCLTSACSDAGSAARCSGTPLSTSCFGPGHSPVGSWRSCGQKPNCWLLPLRPHPAELRARKTLHCLTSACSDAGSAARCSGTPLSTSCFGPSHSPVGSWRSCGQKPNCWLLPLRPHPAELRARKILHCLTSACSDAGSAARCSGTRLNPFIHRGGLGLPSNRAAYYMAEREGFEPSKGY